MAKSINIVVAVLFMFVSLDSSRAFAAGSAAVERERKRTEKLEAIEQLKEVFADGSNGSEPAWMYRVKAGKGAGEIQSTCADLRNFEAKTEGFAEIERRKIRWTDVNLSVRKEEAIVKYTRQGKDLAAKLMKLLNVPADQRAGIKCSGMLSDLGDSPAVVQGVLNILKTAMLNPSSIALEEDKIREKMLEAFQERIEAARAANDNAALKEAAKKAKGWGFGHDDLGLTPEEVQAIQ